MFVVLKFFKSTKSMPAVKVDMKVGVLLSPHHLGSKKMVLESLHVEKSAKGIEYDVFELDNKELNKHYRSLPDYARDLLYSFNSAVFNGAQQKVLNVLLSD